MDYFRETDFYHIIGDFLSLLTISSCIYCKVPQIRIIHENKSAQGVSLNALLLELFSYSTTTLYNFTNHYAMLTYFEYILLLAQEYVLIAIILYYNGMLNKKSYIGAGIYVLLVFLFGTHILPNSILLYFLPLTTPISATSKTMQLVSIIRSKDSSSVSLTTWFISAFTNATRIYTIMLDSFDKMLLANFTVSTVLSSAVWFAAYFYKKPKQA